MSTVYIEHYGTEESNKLVSEINDYLIIKYGFDVKEIINKVPNVILYDNDFNKIVEISSFSRIRELDYFLNFLTKEALTE